MWSYSPAPHNGQTARRGAAMRQVSVESFVTSPPYGRAVWATANLIDLRYSKISLVWILKQPRFSSPDVIETAERGSKGICSNYAADEISHGHQYKIAPALYVSGHARIRRCGGRRRPFRSCFASMPR